TEAMTIRVQASRSPVTSRRAPFTSGCSSACEGNMRFRALLLCAAILVAACKTSAQSVPPEHPMNLGESTMAEPNVPYHVVGTDVAITHHGAAARSFLVDNDPNKQSHSIHATVDVVVAGESKTAEISNEEPYTWKGYRFSIDPIGFSWGASRVRIIVERAQ